MRSKPLAAALMMALLAGLWASRAAAFCGFYVAQADTKLFNKASKVVLVRHMDSTVLTMANDYKGDLTEFALVVPVPTFIEQDQIRVADMAIIDRLDRFSAPRLVEYHDPDPCPPGYYATTGSASQKMVGSITHDAQLEDYGASALGVTIEAEYTVGEYDILILSAKESGGLETWLIQNGYSIPQGASEVLGSYIKQEMRFFVAKVNLDQQASLGFSQLRPLQVSYESPKFMLPIRLGTVNADGPQELFVFAITQKGRVETTNYRTIELPSNMDLPPYIKNEFSNFYKTMFDRQVEKHGMKGVLLEYAWNMSWCDPCADNPLSGEELKEAGVFWLTDNVAKAAWGAQNAFITRLHLRYTAETFPEDLAFQETGNTNNFQGRYVLRHPWTGDVSCDAGQNYVNQLTARQESEAKNLAELTGWDIDEIRAKNPLPNFPKGPWRSMVSVPHGFHWSHSSRGQARTWRGWIWDKITAPFRWVWELITSPFRWLYKKTRFLRDMIHEAPWTTATLAAGIAGLSLWLAIRVYLWKRRRRLQRAGKS